jgi:uncharacterized repeat protein (TIGR03803 family)
MDSAGNLYGTTFDGGANNLGTVFELSPAANGQWTETILYSFAAGDGAQNPMASLVFDSAGNLYGTTEYGGPHAYGAVFKLSPGANGTWTEIHAFAGYPSDGAHPAASLVFDSKGNLYGTTTIGGSGSNCKFNQKPEGCGTVFELSPNANGPWTETLLHSFTITGDDGAFPYGNVILDNAGNLYGTTEQGGVSGNCKVQQLSTCGTVFELTPSGTGTWTEKVLYAFKGLDTDGALPLAGLVMDAEGNLYGTTDVGGNASNPQYDLGFGTVFELSPTAGGKWTESVLHNFQLVSDGALPQSGLLDSSGNLFGTTTGTASNNGSVVFEITP